MPAGKDEATSKPVKRHFKKNEMRRYSSFSFSLPILAKRTKTASMTVGNCQTRKRTVKKTLKTPNPSVPSFRARISEVTKERPRPMLVPEITVK